MALEAGVCWVPDGGDGVSLWRRCRRIARRSGRIPDGLAMTRKAIPEHTQTNILLKSRRRCCLCFWLNGEDEVKKGQFAHMDGDHENSAEDNLAFMCFEHHDEYDTRMRISKGLRQPEVKRWRDELYKEMEYRFRSMKRRGFVVTLVGFAKSGPWAGSWDYFHGVFRLKNTGEVEARRPSVAIRLPADIRGTPTRPDSIAISHQMFDMKESQQDFFEPSGRVAIGRPWNIGNPVLLPDHSVMLEGLSLRIATHPFGSVISLEYRVDAEETPPVRGTFTANIPEKPEGFVVVKYRDK
jgi:hypothetical protein